MTERCKAGNRQGCYRSRIEQKAIDKEAKEAKEKERKHMLALRQYWLDRRKDERFWYPLLL